jgi:hypothetical protein
MEKYVAHTGEMSSHYILVRKPEGKKPLGRPRQRWEDIRSYRNRQSFGSVAGSCEHDNKPCSVICLVEQLLASQGLSSTEFCVCVCVCAVISPKADWILIQCQHQIHMHACMHTCPCTAHPIPPLWGVKWGRVASSFPPLYCTQPGNNEVHYLAKICNTDLIYLHHPQADNNNESACSLVVGGGVSIVNFNTVWDKIVQNI